MKYLGIDASTQSLTATVIDTACPDSVVSESVNFERDLPQYCTSAGAVASKDNPLEVWSYPDMWACALEEVFSKLSEAVNLADIKAVSGSGQQHASVWIRSPEIFKTSSKLPKGSLAQFVKNSLSRSRAPIWLDASTTEECAEITACVGGAENVLNTSGSIATERFSAAQIRKIFKKENAAYNSTGRIHLNSSFICSLMAGADAPVDFGDASGMNLMDFPKLCWSEKLLAATAPNLRGKLPALRSSKTLAGKISAFFVLNYGFSKDANVYAFTGDNPSSLVGSGVSDSGFAAVSLGTSDTFFCSNRIYNPVPNAHVFGNPQGGYMNLICFRNGSLSREKFKEDIGVDWNFFDNVNVNTASAHLENSFIIPFYCDEISPKFRAAKPVLVNADKKNLSKAELVRLFLEGQFLNMYVQSKRVGAKIDRIVLTGGASKSPSIANCISNIFSADIFHMEKSSNSAALGAALRAANLDSKIPMQELEKDFCPLVHICSPTLELKATYAAKAEKFESMLDGTTI